MIAQALLMACEYCQKDYLCGSNRKNSPHEPQYDRRQLENEYH